MLYKDFLLFTVQGDIGKLSKGRHFYLPSLVVQN